MTEPSSLYDADFYVWTRRQAELLRQGRFADLDSANLAEEIEDLGRNDLHAVESHVETIIQHLLKLQFSPAEAPRRGWAVTVETQRSRLRRRLSVSLRNKVAAALDDLYADARRPAAIELAGDGIERNRLPSACPYSLDQIIDPDWLPDSLHGLGDPRATA